MRGIKRRFCLDSESPLSWWFRKQLILLHRRKRQVPKVLVPRPGGHDIAFLYPLIPCVGDLCLFERVSRRTVLDGIQGVGNEAKLFEMRRKRAVQGEAAVEVRNMRINK